MGLLHLSRIFRAEVLESIGVRSSLVGVRVSVSSVPSVPSAGAIKGGVKIDHRGGGELAHFQGGRRRLSWALGLAGAARQASER